ncbi:LysR family transcriptional regulator [Pseudomonas sp. LA21]|uniref:LysR family transcriptional regulator n=1 Tax=unclassified Pseudomonas TaxID=196821 RepID=UPI001FB85866|nr:LysR family transcriptional regulator [Pseudomonas sp. LA21]MCJ1886627.1 LysR family transcriptional regulator [Pseudomonas sp. LA21]
MFEHLPIDRQLAQIFLTSARCACFRQTARSLNLHVTLMRRQLMKLEASIGSPLFFYENRTLRLSPTGKALQQALTLRFGDLQPEVASTRRRRIRLAVPSDLLDDFLARDLIAWLRKDAAMNLEILPLEGPPEEPAEVTVWLADPDSPRPDPGFAMSKPTLLARLHYCAHMAKRYAGRRLPRAASDLTDFMLAQHSANDSIRSFEPWNKLLRQRQSSVAQVHSQAWVRELVRNSACIGLLPAYVTKLERNLLPLEPLFRQPMERIAWLSVAPLAANLSEVEALVAIVQRAFEQRRDWFTADN